MRQEHRRNELIKRSRAGWYRHGRRYFTFVTSLPQEHHGYYPGFKMPTLETYNGYHLWRYVPSLPASIVFAALFGLLTIAHAWRMLRHRMWFCIPIVVGGICKFKH